MSCQRPLRGVLGDAAYCNACGAKRGEPCPREGPAPSRVPLVAVKPKTTTVGSSSHGISFTWERTDPYVMSDGQLSVNIWNSLDHESAWIVLDVDEALSLAQFLDDVLDR